MKDLISREALLQQIGEKLNVLRGCNDFKEAWGMKYAMVMIQNAPAVDAVEVVRCGGCEHYVPANGKDSGKPCGYGQCGLPTGIRGIVCADDFCSFSARMDGE